MFCRRQTAGVVAVAVARGGQQTKKEAEDEEANNGGPLLAIPLGSRYFKTERPMARTAGGCGSRVLFKIAKGNAVELNERLLSSVGSLIEIELQLIHSTNNLPI